MSPPIAGAWGSTEVPHWPFLIAFSFFRIAAIVPGRLQARARRQRLQPASAARKMGAAVPMMARLAMETIAAG